MGEEVAHARRGVRVLGNVLADEVVEVKAALFVEHEDGRRREGLRDGTAVRGGVRGERHARPGIRRPEPAGVHLLAAAAEHHRPVEVPAPVKRDEQAVGCALNAAR
jgi:hypothetical protein